jgi:hypothetical protein
MNVQASPKHHLTKSRLCVVLLETPNNAVSRHIPRTLCGYFSYASLSVTNIVRIFHTAIIVGLSVCFCIVVYTVKEAKDMNKSVAFQSFAAERREKLLQ